MKLYNVFILLFVLGVGAQRRATKAESDAESSSHRPNGRGRARFALSSEAIDLATEPSIRPERRKTDAVKKTDRRVPSSSTRPYEVEEIIDDIPNEDARKLHKPRVITETRFEAANAPRKPLFIPVPLPEEELSPEELIASFGPSTTNSNTEKVSESVKKVIAIPMETLVVSPVNEISASTEEEELIDTSPKFSQMSELTTASEQPSSTENEIKRKQPEAVVTVTPVPDARKVSSVRTQVRPRTHSSVTEDTITQASRSRTRGRPSHRKEPESSESTASVQSTRIRSRGRQELTSETSENPPKIYRTRHVRKRLDSSESSESGIKGRGPSVFSTESSQEYPSRSRTGRKVNSPITAGSERREYRAVEEKSYVIRSRRIESKDQQLNFETTNDLSTPASEEKEETSANKFSEERLPSEISRTRNRRRKPIQKEQEATQSKASKTRSSSNRSNRSRSRSAEVRQENLAENKPENNFRGRGRKHEEHASAVNNRRANVIRSRKVEASPNQDVNGKTNEVPKVDLLEPTVATSKRAQETVKLDENPVGEAADVSKLAAAENRRFPSRTKEESPIFESNIDIRRSGARNRAEVASAEGKLQKVEVLESRRSISRTRIDTATENILQKNDNKKPDITSTTENVKKSVALDVTVTTIKNREELPFDALNYQQPRVPINSRFPTRKKEEALVIENVPQKIEVVESKRSNIRSRSEAPTTENIAQNFTPRSKLDIPVVENYIKTPEASEIKRINGRNREESTKSEVKTKEDGLNVENNIQKSAVPESARPRSRGLDTRRNGRKQTTRSETKAPKPETSSRRRIHARLNNAVSAEALSKGTSTERFDKFRTRQRTRIIPPIIDEQKLEVLPLFESEAKTIRPISDVSSSERRRSNALKDDLAVASTTERLVKASANNEPTKSVGQGKIRGQIVHVETVTETSEEIRIQTRKPIIRESVESQITEGVPSRKIVLASSHRTSAEVLANGAKRRHKVTIKVGAPKITISEAAPSSRGSKKADIVSSEKSGEDSIEESDNYPEAFKALLQAKLSKQPTKGSRSQSSEESVTKSSEKVMTSTRISTTTTTTATTSKAAPSSSTTTLSGRGEDTDNELIPKPSSTTTNPRSTRRRFSLATKSPLTVDSTTAKPIKRSSGPTRKTVRSSLPPPTPIVPEVAAYAPKENRYHARFASDLLEQKLGSSDKTGLSTTAKGRSFAPTPSRGVYSSRKVNNKKLDGKERSKNRSNKPQSSFSSPQVSSSAVAPKKSSLFSSRYRSDLLSRIGSTRSTPPPAYIPTVPTVTPAPAKQVKSGVAIEENLSGMEVIFIDEPVNTIPSDSLVNGELLTPSNPFNPSSNLFPAALVTRNQVHVSNELNTTGNNFVKVTKNGAPTTAQTMLSKPAEKPVSIIERIIYSITAISTTSSPDVTIDSITNVGPTVSSAIFKIPNKTTKISEKTDVTFDQTVGKETPLLNRIDSSTTEKPTTIIERILSSLSAIQANTTDMSQVGNNLNSISTTFKPLSRSTTISSTVSSTLSHEANSTVDPLVVLEQISSEQSLQQRTISQLLALLKSINPTTPQQDDVVIVTPKTTTFVSSTTESPTAAVNPDVEVFNVSSNTLTSTPVSPVPQTPPSSNVAETPTPASTANTVANSDVEVFNVSSNLITSTPEKQAASSVATTPSQNAEEITTVTSSSTIFDTPGGMSSSSSKATNAASGNTSESIESERTIPNISENSIIEDTLTTLSPSSIMDTTSQARASVNTRFSAAISISDFISSLTASPETTTIIPNPTTNNAESAETIPSIDQVSTLVASTENPLNPSNIEITTTPDTSDTTVTESSQTENLVTIAPRTSRPVTTTDQLTTSPSQEEVVATIAVENIDANVITSNPVNTNPPTSTESTLATSTSAPTTELPSTLSEQLSRLLATGNMGTLSTISTTLSIEQTSILNPTTDTSVTATIPQLPTLPNFEVSPGSVTIFSANDISSTFNAIEDGTTVTILSRSFLTTPSSTEAGAALESTTTSSNTNPVTLGDISSNSDSVLTMQKIMATTAESSLTSTASNSDDSATELPTTTDSTEPPVTTSIPSSMTSEDAFQNNTENNTTQPQSNAEMSSESPVTTNMPSTEQGNDGVSASQSEVIGANNTGNTTTQSEQLQTNAEISSSTSIQNITTNVTQTNQTDTNSVNVNATITERNLSLSNRVGQLVEFAGPVQNNIETSSVAPAKDYFIFAVLPNNTIVRKRPSLYPTKDTPFIIVGVYPNNTVVQKFLNGTLIPEEPIIQVSGFDTRPLPEITSNQVTQPNQESRPDNKNLQTADITQNSVSAVEANRLSIEPTTTTMQPPTATLPTLSDLLAGKTIQAFNNIVNQTNEGKPIKFETLDVDTLVQSRAGEIGDVNVEENTISSNGNTGPEKVVQSTTPTTTSSTSAAVTTSSTSTEPTTTPTDPSTPPRTTIKNEIPAQSRQTIKTTSSSPPPTLTTTLTPMQTATARSMQQKVSQTTLGANSENAKEPTRARVTTSGRTTTIATTRQAAEEVTTPRRIPQTTSVPSTVGPKLTTPVRNSARTTPPTTPPPRTTPPNTTPGRTTSPPETITTVQARTTPPSTETITIAPIQSVPPTTEVLTPVTPEFSARFGMVEANTIRDSPTTMTVREREPLTEPIATTPFRGIRYTTTPTSVNSRFERLESTVPTTETLSVIQKITRRPATSGRSRGPATTVTPTPNRPNRNRMRTTPVETTPAPTTTTADTSTAPKETTTTATSTMRMRKTTTNPITTTEPMTTTFVTQRYTSTPTTVNSPRRRVTTAAPRIRLTTTPSITEQPIISNNYISPSTTPRSFDASTLFPVYARPEVNGATQVPALEVATNVPTKRFISTLPSRSRQRGSTLPPDLTTILPTSNNLEQLAKLRVQENYGELSTTGDYMTPTTLSPSVASTFNPATLQTTLRSINSKVRLLTDQQKKDLEELARLEEEQKAILQQLAFLTRLNLGGTSKPTRSPSNLANRVLDFAAERNKVTTTEPSPLNILEALTASNSRESKKIASSDGKNPSIEDVLKQLNVNPNSVTTSSLSSTYGKSTDAILAALLKEQGIGPSTPKSLGDQLRTTTPIEYSSTTSKIVTTTKKRTTTTARPGPLMRGLNWLLNALEPQPTTPRRPVAATKRTTTTSKPKTVPFDVELLTNQPTEMSPVIVTAPPRLIASASAKTARTSSRSKRPLHSLSEVELQSLITQLEEIQKDPTQAKTLDLSPFQSTPKTTTIVANNAVQITNSGKVGSSSKLPMPSPDISATEPDVVPLVYKRGRTIKSTTAVPSGGVSNSILEDVKQETVKPPRRTTLPPVRLSPVHGVDDEEEPQVRGQLINAAVNVTRAISQFLGSAIQDAAHQLTNLFSNGSGNLRNYFSSSSVLPTVVPTANSTG